MKRLYFDTETTGFPAREGSPLNQQPHIIQLAALLYDDAEGEVASMNVLIQPDNWKCSEGAAAVHGITDEKAARFGVPILHAMGLFSQLVRTCDQLVAHNITFDLKLIAFECERIAKQNLTLSREHFCTMASTTNICKIIQRGRNTFKWPKLIEAHQHFFQETFDGAHDALADVRACQRIHNHLIIHGLV